MTHADTLAAQQSAFATLLQDTSAAAPAHLLRSTADHPPRIDVYQHAYRARLIEALRSNFPVLHRVLGDDDFGELALDYLREHPSRHPSIRWFGDALPEWLADRADSLPHPSLADLAAMEWAIGTSFDAADTPTIRFDLLAALTPAQWIEQAFLAHPSVRLVPLTWAVEPAWQALTQDETAETGEPEPLRHTLLVWRQDLDTQWRSLSDEEADALTGLVGGCTFAELCARAAGRLGDDAPAWVAGALRRWVDDGLLAQAG